MGKDHLDASLGLAFSVAVFEKYRKNGLLQAELSHVPGLRGRCKAYLQLTEGKVTSCHVEDKSGKRHPIDKNTLIRLDNERGPFEWMLVPLPAPPLSTSGMNISLRQEVNSPTPVTIAHLNLQMLEGWTFKQQLMLSAVYEAIDGQRNIEEIKKEVPLSPQDTEEILRVLLALKVISFT